jgi:hypothetical protein
VDNPRSIVDFCLYVKYAQVCQQSRLSPNFAQRLA